MLLWLYVRYVRVQEIGFGSEFVGRLPEWRLQTVRVALWACETLRDAAQHPVALRAALHQLGDLQVRLMYALQVILQVKLHTCIRRVGAITYNMHAP